MTYFSYSQWDPVKRRNFLYPIVIAEGVVYTIKIDGEHVPSNIDINDPHIHPLNYNTDQRSPDFDNMLQRSPDFNNMLHNSVQQRVPPRSLPPPPFAWQPLIYTDEYLGQQERNDLLFTVDPLLVTTTYSTPSVVHSSESTETITTSASTETITTSASTRGRGPHTPSGTPPSSSSSSVGSLNCYDNKAVIGMYDVATENFYGVLKQERVILIEKYNTRRQRIDYYDLTLEGARGPHRSLRLGDRCLGAPIIGWVDKDIWDKYKKFVEREEVLHPAPYTV